VLASVSAFFLEIAQLLFQRLNLASHFPALSSPPLATFLNGHNLISQPLILPLANLVLGLPFVTALLKEVDKLVRRALKSV